MLEEDRELYTKIWRYGLLVTNFTVQNYVLDIERVTIYKFENKLYWVRQLNGEPIEIKTLN